MVGNFRGGLLFSLSLKRRRGCFAGWGVLVDVMLGLGVLGFSVGRERRITFRWWSLWGVGGLTRSVPCVEGAVDGDGVF